MKNTAKYKNLTDEQLMHLFQKTRDKAIFSEVYNRYFSVLCRYINWMSDGSISPEDIAQNILVKLYRKPTLFDTEKNLKVWLFVAAKNRVKNAFRNQANRNMHHQFIQHAQKKHTEIKIDGETTNKMVQVQSLLQNISESHREVFILKYANNLSIQEISEVLECSPGTVKSRLFYALQKMRSQLPQQKKTTS